jgi:hypothetical protein
MEVLMITRQQAKIKKIEGNNAICTKWRSQWPQSKWGKEIRNTQTKRGLRECEMQPCEDVELNVLIEWMFVT